LGRLVIGHRHEERLAVARYVVVGVAAHQEGASNVVWHYVAALRALRRFSEFEALIRPQK
jgi:hypothetical protein